MECNNERVRSRLAGIDWWKAALWVGFIVVLIVAINGARKIDRLEKRVIVAERSVHHHAVINRPVQIVYRGRGPTGPTGAQGPAGPRGLSGRSGHAGRNGSAGSNGSPGRPGDIIHTREVIVERAKPGPRGPRGPQGPKGLRGTPGVSVNLPIEQIQQQVAGLQGQINSLLHQLPK